MQATALDQYHYNISETEVICEPVKFTKDTFYSCILRQMQKLQLINRWLSVYDLKKAVIKELQKKLYAEDKQAAASYKNILYQQIIAYACHVPPDACGANEELLLLLASINTIYKEKMATKVDNLSWKKLILDNQDFVMLFTKKIVDYADVLNTKYATPVDMLQRYKGFFLNASDSEWPQELLENSDKSYYEFLQEITNEVWGILSKNYRREIIKELNVTEVYQILDRHNAVDLYLDNILIQGFWAGDIEIQAVHNLLQYKYPNWEVNLVVLNTSDAHMPRIGIHDIVVLRDQYYYSMVRDLHASTPMHNYSSAITPVEYAVNFEPIDEQEARIRAEIGLINHDNYIRDRWLRRDNLLHNAATLFGLAMSVAILSQFDFTSEFKPAVMFTLGNHVMTMVSLSLLTKQKFVTMSQLSRQSPNLKSRPNHVLQYIMLALTSELALLSGYAISIGLQDYTAIATFTYLVNILPYIIPSVLNNYIDYKNYHTVLPSQYERKYIAEYIDHIDFHKYPMIKREFKYATGLETAEWRQEVVDMCNSQNPEMLFLLRAGTFKERLVDKRLDDIEKNYNEEKKELEAEINILKLNHQYQRPENNSL